MGDNKGQTIFLSVIGIATLLVAIIGATFAYFTTTVNSDNVSGGSTEGTTAKLSGTTLTFQKNTQQTHEYLQYPGGLAVFGTKAEFKKDDNGDTNDYVATFDLEIEYTNPTSTTLHYTLYMLENAPSEADLDPACELITQTGQNVDGKEATFLWYGNEGDDGSEGPEGKECTFGANALAAFGSATTVASGDLTGSGKIDRDTEVGGEDNKIESGDRVDQNPLKGRQLDTRVGGTSTKYYYLVVDYPNENKDQSADATGGTISVSLKITDGSIKVDKGTVTE